MSALTNVAKRVPEGFGFQYIVAIRGGRPTHMWTLANAAGGIHIHGFRSAFDGCTEWMGGIEVHSPKPMYDFASEPSQQCCWLLGGPCWHDGSSLAFSERLADLFFQVDPEQPIVDQYTHDRMLNVLLDWHSSKFANADDEAAS